MKVLIADKLSQIGIDWLESQSEYDVGDVLRAVLAAVEAMR